MRISFGYVPGRAADANLTKKNECGVKTGSFAEVVDTDAPITNSLLTFGGGALFLVYLTLPGGHGKAGFDNGLQQVSTKHLMYTHLHPRYIQCLHNAPDVSLRKMQARALFGRFSKGLIGRHAQSTHNPRCLVLNGPFGAITRR